MFVRLQNRKRVATRYDRCPIIFLSGIFAATTVVLRL